MKKIFTRIGGVLLSLITAFSLVACNISQGGNTGSSLNSSSSSKNDSSSSGGNDSSSSGGGSDKKQVYDPETRPVVFATDALDGNFNPFFATSATDSKMAAMTQIGMLSTDAKGNPVCGEDEATVVLDYKTTMLDDNGEETLNGENAKYTDYEFIIKNGIKFSDGVELTIKDVLFNLYVYLDPAYMGSSTIYSTDIVGLTSYRLQDPDADEGMSESMLMGQFTAAANVRINNLREYLDHDNNYVKPTGDALAQIEKDIATAKTLFREEITTDWTSCAGTQESYKDEYTFTEDWEIYYYNEGIITLMSENGKYVKKDGKYVANDYSSIREAIEAQMNDAANIAAAKDYYGCTTDDEAKAYIARDYAIDTVYDSYTTTDSSLYNVVTYWATASNLHAKFEQEAQTEYFANKTDADKVESVSGITTTTTDTDYDGNKLSATHDVLKIRINGVDPKAIWNFAFAVAPMHYYSNEDAIKNTKYGVKFSDSDFFDNVLKATEKNGKPVGAGSYMASNEKGSAAQTTKDNFYRNNWVYYERNPYFETVGKNISNAKIKYLRYKVVGSNKILQSLQAGDIDFGEPQATTSNITEISKYSNTLSYAQYRTNGYGYVGVNPKYVPDIEVRRAIMMAMDTASIVRNYYTEQLADVVYRSMSKTSWAYPEDAEEYYEYTQKQSVIKELVESAGWAKNTDGIYVKNGKKLTLTFTIAGETTDHPAYDMFVDAANFLNKCGFDITVTTDISALKKLATGGLAVWAAAWSSTVDPDLYQVYHKDSNATSTKNWGYDTIFADTTGQFDYEQKVINSLSEQIEAARSTIVEAERKAIYSECLDLIMALAVELPTYQRNDLVVYNKKVIDSSTLNSNPSANDGVYDRIWEVNYN